MGGQAFRLDEHLVAVLVGEAMDLVLDRRAVARANTFDHPGVHRRAVEVGGDDLVSTRVGMGDPATDLLGLMLTLAEEGHQRRGCITRLLGHHREIHGTTVDAWRRAGLQATDAQWQLTQAMRQSDGGRITGTAAGVVLQTNVDKSAEESACGQNHGIRVEPEAHLGDHALDLSVFHNQVISSLLKNPQVGLVFQNFAYRSLVQHAVGLRTCGANGWALAAVEDTELDATLVGSSGHGTTKCIDFLDQVALADPTDGRVAAHLAEGLDIVGEQQGLHAHACCSQGCFGTGMTATDHDHVKTGREIHHAPRAC